MSTNSTMYELRPRALKPVQGLMGALYNTHGKRAPFCAEHSFLYRKAIDDILAANIEILDDGGRLYVTQVWRSPYEQYMRYFEYRAGLRTSPVLAPGQSMHEVGRAIDIDTRPEQMKIPHEALRAILVSHNWYPIVEIGEKGDHHYEWRDEESRLVRHEKGYLAMVRHAWKALKADPILFPADIDYSAAEAPEHWL